ncbi:hypothetical protein V5O48_018301 [Marasmius crinis-equi]|uniref:Uncharacterized protein n=1 Tax=Marasmius crinis-equi TaxID=585013 RepID=A0ABR3ELM0_9AGAR
MLNLHRSAPNAGILSTTSMSGNIVFGSVSGTSATTSTDVELDILHTDDMHVVSTALTEPNEDEVDRNRELPERKAEASYDDIPALPAADPGLNPPPTPYKGLVYSGFSANAAGLPFKTDHSIYYGNLVLQTVRDNGFPKISKADNVKSFDLDSFTFVCGLQSAESAKGVGYPCKIKLTGWKGTNQVAYKECEFQHSLLDLSIEPSWCTPEFKDVDSVGFESVTILEVAEIALITAIDNVDVDIRCP